MSTTSVQDQERVAKLIDAWKSPRYRALDRLDRFVECTQYEGLKSWWDEDAPIWEKAPCIVHPTVSEGIESNVDLCYGEGRFPFVTTRPEEDDADDEDDESDVEALDEEQSEVVDRFTRRLMKKSRFESAIRQAYAYGQGCGTACVIAAVKNDRLCLDIQKAKFCTPTFDRATGAVSALVIEYPYVEHVRQQDGSWRSIAYLYRRRIDDQTDTTFAPVELEDALTGRATFTPDERRTVRHGLGFVPVVWWRRRTDAGLLEGQVDGTAIHALCLETVRAHDMSLSQRHRATLWCGDPQIVETGVEAGTLPTAPARHPTAVPGSVSGGPLAGPNDPNRRGEFVAGPRAPRARRKSPGVVWTYESPDAKVAYLALQPGTLETIDDHTANLRAKAAESMAVVFLDPESAKLIATVLSGKAIELLRARQIARVAKDREDMEEGLLAPLLTMLFRLVAKFAANIKIGGARRVAEIAAPLLGDAMSSMPFTFKWGPLSPPTIEDDAKIVDVAIAARDGGVITRRTAVEKVARIFGIEDVESYVERLEEEREANMPLEQAEAMAKGLGVGVRGGKAEKQPANASEAEADDE